MSRTGRTQAAGGLVAPAAGLGSSGLTLACGEARDLATGLAVDSECVAAHLTGS